MGYVLLVFLTFLENLLISLGAFLTISVGGISFFGYLVPFAGSAYAFAIALERGVSLPFAVILALIFGSIIGYFFTLLYSRLSDDSFAVFTLASLLAFQALLLSWDSVTGGVLGISGVARPALFATLPSLALGVFIVTALCILGGHFLLSSSFGRALRAHKENPRLLDSIGTSSYRVESIVILLSNFLAAVSGIFTLWQIQFLDPSFSGIPFFIVIITIAILAFHPKIEWLIGAGFLITVIPEFLRFLPLPATMLGHLRTILYCVVLIILVHYLSKTYTNDKRTV